MELFIKLLTDKESVHEFYKNHSCNHKEDSGLDLVCPENLNIPANAISFKIPLKIAAMPLQKNGYYLYPRSSISKTPLRLCNSVGIIDMNYRGQIMAVVDNISNEEFNVKEGNRLFQLCSPDLKPISFQLKEELTKTGRGEGGFGSTGF